MQEDERRVYINVSSSGIQTKKLRVASGNSWNALGTAAKPNISEVIPAYIHAAASCRVVRGDQHIEQH